MLFLKKIIDRNRATQYSRWNVWLGICNGSKLLLVFQSKFVFRVNEISNLLLLW